MLCDKVFLMDTNKTNDSTTKGGGRFRYVLLRDMSIGDMLTELWIRETAPADPENDFRIAQLKYELDRRDATVTV